MCSLLVRPKKITLSGFYCKIQIQTGFIGPLQQQKHQQQYPFFGGWSMDCFFCERDEVFHLSIVKNEKSLFWRWKLRLHSNVDFKGEIFFVDINDVDVFCDVTMNELTNDATSTFFSFVDKKEVAIETRFYVQLLRT